MNSLQSIRLLTAAFVLIAASAEGQTPARKPVATPSKVGQPATRTSQSTAKPVAVKPAPATPQTTQSTPAQQPAKPTMAPASGQQTASVAQPQRTAPSTQPRAGVTTNTHKAPVAKIGHRTSYLNGGIGLASYWGGGIPIGVSYETTLIDNLSVGGSLDYAHYGRNYGGYKWSYNFIYAGARGSYHFGELLETSDKFDPYAGISLGFRFASYKDTYGYTSDYYNPYNSGLYMGIHVGGRYYFTDKIGGFAEVGYGVSALRLGVTAKF